MKISMLAVSFLCFSLSGCLFFESSTPSDVKKPPGFNNGMGGNNGQGNNGATSPYCTENDDCIVECGENEACNVVGENVSCEQIYGVGWTGDYICEDRCKITDTCVLTNPFVQVSAGGLHSCALREDGSVYCWGHNDGQLNVPNLVFSQIAAGGWHTCGIVEGGQSIRCWGSSSRMENGIAGLHNAPTGLIFTQIRSDFQHSCALTDSGEMRCWGDVNYFPGFRSLSNIDEVALGRWHTCVRVQNVVECAGETQNGAGVSSPSARMMSLGGGGDDFACGLDTNGETVGWGGVPPGFFNQTNFTQLDAGRRGICATGTNVSQCWGHVADEQPNFVFNEVSVGDFHACGLFEGEPVCWPGDGIDGTFGLGNTPLDQGQAVYLPEFPVAE